jgi:type VI protein secretion system component Hcp
MNNPVESPQSRRQAEQLTELELCNVSGGTQSTGAGAGKVTFNPFSITKRVDKASPQLFL